MIPEYQYRIHDHSVITPVFKKWIVAPLFRLMPWSIPANVITIVFNISMYIALYMALTEWPANRTLRFISISLLVLCYAIGDHMDGMQAKRTGTSSALGELCDHYLDIFNNGILLYVVCLSFRIQQPHLVAFFLTASYLAHATMFYEQFSTKWLYFEKIGSLESLLILVCCLLAASINVVYSFVSKQLIFGLTIAEAAFILSSSGAFVTIIGTIRRARIVNTWFYAFCAFLILIACLGSTFLSSTLIFYIIMMYSSLYIGNLQRGHLADGKEHYPDVVTPLYIALAFVFEPLRHPAYLWGLYVYLMGHTLWIAGNSAWILKSFWVWCNPPKKPEINLP